MKRVKSRHVPRAGRRRSAEPDYMAIEMACSGLKIRLYPNELRVAIRRLLREYNGLEVAEILGVCDRTVYRHKKALSEDGSLDVLRSRDSMPSAALGSTVAIPGQAQPTTWD